MRDLGGAEREEEVPIAARFEPLFSRSSPLRMKLEMIVAGLRRSKSFGLARPHARVWHHSSSPHAATESSTSLHPAGDLLQHCCYALDPWYIACLLPPSTFLPHAKGIESRHVEDRHRASRWCILHWCALVEPRLLAQ